jgi:hypothetical protein
MRYLVVLALVLAALPLASCRGGEPLLTTVYTTGSPLRVTGDNGAAPAVVHYSLSRPGSVTVWLTDGDGARHVLRERQPRPAASDYQLSFDGTYAASADAIERRVVPPGRYQVTVQAFDDQGLHEQRVTEVAVVAADTEPPHLERLVAYPDVISPNFDAVDDVAQISFRLSKDARVSIYATDEHGRKAYVGVREEKRDAGEYAETWSGVVNERPLRDGVYQYTVEARDPAGNVSVARVPVWLESGGVPKAKITSVYIAPRRVLLGGTVQVEVRVKNVGDTIIRTQGPSSGFMYNSYESFGSVADGEFIDRAGFWRLGIDWQGAPVTAGARFPYRWGFGHDLAPGEEVVVQGAIQMLHRITKVWLYAGLIQEGHRYYDDGVGRALVEVSF